MIGRVRQFVRAVTARVTDEDRAYVASVLPEQAVPLFYAMHRADQRHALNVTRTAMALADERERDGARVNRALLERCALLHDVGRRRGDLDIFGKVACVLLVHVFPARSKRWADNGTSAMLRVYYHHPQIGAELLRGIGLFLEASIIERHHAPAQATDPIELTLLRAADEAN
ncbi:HD domain-containing protein [Selenomonas sp.]|uniref:HD domain-containing protein n=1 Tax=Selenomonas sp. TaxID=2053611 RepID=UPI0025F0C3B9|nr:HD domain-containing protein [Selenomonas sp.]MCI6283339.1 HDIG domain-containing protein [Selenomonas sp.]